jgi:hypothetical protein
LGMLGRIFRRTAEVRFKRHLRTVDLTRPIPDRPMCKHTVWKILSRCRTSYRSQVLACSSATTHLRYAFMGKRSRHSHHSGDFGPQLPKLDADLRSSCK